MLIHRKCVDKNGKTALDFVKEKLSGGSNDISIGGNSKQKVDTKPSTAQLGGAMECSLLLHNALTVHDLGDRSTIPIAGRSGTNELQANPSVVSMAGPVPHKQKRMTRSTTKAASTSSNPTVSASNMNIPAAVDDDAFVYDIFCLQTVRPHSDQHMDSLDMVPPMGSGGVSEGSDGQGSDSNLFSNCNTDNMPETESGSGDIDPSSRIIQIPGLHIDEGGNIITYLDEAQQQHFVYDSDWSDLGGKLYM